MRNENGVQHKYLAYYLNRKLSRSHDLPSADQMFSYPAVMELKQAPLANNR